MTADNQIDDESDAGCQTSPVPEKKHAQGVTPAHHTINAETPISRLYLTFDSDLPPPPATIAEAPAPDLKHYSSPLTWSPGRKGFHLTMGCISTFLTAYTAGAYAPPLGFIVHDMGSTQIVGLVGITTFCLGFASAPMVLAPVSEIWGRYPVFVAAGCVSVAFMTACALVTTIAGMLVCRFVVGAGVSSFSSVVGGVLADLWVNEDRNTPMAIFCGCVLVATGAGPLISAVIVEWMPNHTLAWKWSFWHQVIANGVLIITLILFFKETRASVLLRHKARCLNRWYEELESHGIYGVFVRDADADANSPASTVYEDHAARSLRRIRWSVQADEERASLSSMMATSVMRPFHMLVTEPVVFFFSLWAAFSWSILYLAFAVIPYLHGDDFSSSMRAYVAMMAGAVVATVISIWQEDLLKHPKWQSSEDADEEIDSHFWAFMRRHFPAEAPEARLYFACIAGFLLPIGLCVAFLSPPTSSPDDRGTALAVGIGLATWGIYNVYLAAFNYMVDTYHVYASSALAANSFCRNILGGSFPVVTAPMFDAMGVKGAGGLLAACGFALTATPWVLVIWGAKIRGKSRMAIMLRKQ